MINKSGFEPRGMAVLVEPYEPEFSSPSGLVIPPSVREKTSVVEQRAIVVAIGPMAWDAEKEPRAKVGDLVMISKWAGWAGVGPADGKLYRFINCNDIFAVITDEALRAKVAA